MKPLESLGCSGSPGHVEAVVGAATAHRQRDNRNHRGQVQAWGSSERETAPVRGCSQDRREPGLLRALAVGRPRPHRSRPDGSDSSSRTPAVALWEQTTEANNYGLIGRYRAEQTPQSSRASSERTGPSCPHGAQDAHGRACPAPEGATSSTGNRSAGPDSYNTIIKNLSFIPFPCPAPLDVMACVH